MAQPDHDRLSDASQWQGNRVHVPADILTATDALSSLDALMCAREWHRAAIVYAFTTPQQGARTDLTSVSSGGSDFTQHTLSEFAQLGIIGLNSPVTVRKYRRAWEWAMENGEAEESRPGVDVDLPAMDWRDVPPDDSGGAHVSHNSGDMEWCTPAEIVDSVRAVLGEIDLDPASTVAANEVVKAKLIFTADDDGLAREWHGRVFLNPPYRQPDIRLFAEKLVEEHAAGRVPEAVLLSNNATEAKWFQAAGLMASAIAFPAGRIRYWHPDKPDALAPLQGQAILYLGENPGVFTAEFSKYGLTW